MASNFHPLEVKEIKKETINTVSIIFQVPEHLANEFRYEAGQYLTIKSMINNEDVRRSYSISSYTTTDQELQVSCKMIEGGKMSTFLFKELGVGDTLDVMAPMGNFTWDKPNDPLVLFAAGSGITPIFSLLKKALTEGQNTVHLYYGNRSDEEIIFKEGIEELRTQYPDRLLVQHFLSSNGERLDSSRTESLIHGIEGAKTNAQYYICGPEGMIASVKSGLEHSGIGGHQINIEYFASPKTETPTSEIEVSGEVGDIIAEIDGEKFSITMEDGESILDAANRIGIDPPFSCQSGVCTTCKCKVMSGNVEMENNFGLGSDEEEEGFVLACISKPTSAGVLVSWDEV